MRINGIELTTGERGVYGKADTRARLAYLKKHGSPATINDPARPATASTVRANAAAWKLEHGAAYAAAGERAGVSAVKKLHTRYAADGYAPSVARLEVLGLAGRTPRKRATAPAVAVVAPETVPTVVAAAEPVNAPETAAPDVWAPVIHAAAEVCDGGAENTGPACRFAGGCTVLEVPADMTCEVCADIVAMKRAAGDLEPPAAPVTVPAPMPAQIRAARRQSNRELAAAMRAAGLEPRGEAWRMARDGVSLEDIGRQLATAAGGAA